MMPNDDWFGEEWTTEERAAFDALAGERVPPHALEVAITNALRQRGLLRRARSTTVVRVTGVAAAAVILFASGVLAGYTIGARQSALSATRRPTPSAGVTPESAAVGQVTARGQVIWY
jgi:hypothetical protein